MSYVRVRVPSISGFALMELLLALSLMALIAALALPAIPRSGGPASLRATAFQAAALFCDTRTRATMAGHSEVVTIVAGQNRLQSSGGLSFVLPAGVHIASYDAPIGGISFSADGHSSGGLLVLEGAASRWAVAVSAGTGAIHAGSP